MLTLIQILVVVQYWEISTIPLNTLYWLRWWMHGKVCDDHFRAAASPRPGRWRGWRGWSRHYIRPAPGTTLATPPPLLDLDVLMSGSRGAEHSGDSASWIMGRWGVNWWPHTETIQLECNINSRSYWVESSFEKDHKVRYLLEKNFHRNISIDNKFALLWGEAQSCLPKC